MYQARAMATKAESVGSAVEHLAAAEQPLKMLVPVGWRRELDGEFGSPSFQKLENFLKRQPQARVFPPRAQIFSALKQTPLAHVKVVIIGQDPYPTRGNANGLSFSVNKGVAIPGSLKNIFAGLRTDVGITAPSSGDLTPWAKRGVLLLNTVLTVQEGAAGSHQKQGWEEFTEAILKKVNEQPGPVVFLCFGKPAEAMAKKLVDTSRHTILAAPHPSPLNGKAFVRSVEQQRQFTRTNEILEAAGRGPVDWSLP